MGLVRAEWVKTFSLKLWWLMLLFGALLVILLTLPFLLISGVAAEEGMAELDLTQPGALTTIWTTIGSATVIALLIGVLSFTGETRHGTLTDTFLTEPRRLRVLAAKAVVAAIQGVFLAVVATGVVMLLVLWLLPEPHAPVQWGDAVTAGLAAALVYALYAVLGVSFGALVPVQVAAVVLGILWVLLVENILAGLLPAVAPYLPGSAAAAIGGSPDLLAPGVAVLVLVGYAVALAAIAGATTLRRDIS